MSGPIWVVAAALTDPAGRVLVQRRPAERQHGGLWEFPGGKIEPGETPAAALARELEEELGLAVGEVDLAPVTFAADAGIVLLLFRCERWRGEARATDGAALRWLRPEELAGLPMPPADRPLAVALVQAGTQPVTNTISNRSATRPSGSA